MSGNQLERVNRIIIDLGLSQTEFARRIGLDASKLSKSLSGKRRFSSLEYAEIAAIGNRTVDWILNGTEPRAFRFQHRTALADTTDVDAAGRELVSLIAERFEGLHFLRDLEPVSTLPSWPQSGVYVREANGMAEKVLRALDVPLVGLSQEGVINAIEVAFDVHVVVIDLPEGSDGLSFSDGDFRIIVLATSSSAARQRFTLLHELAHVLFGDAENSLIEEAIWTAGVDKTYEDKRADAFAAAVLMPRPIIDKIVDGRRIEEAFPELAWKLCVSPLSLSWRLLNLRLIDKDARRKLGQLTSLGVARNLDKASDVLALNTEAQEPRPARQLARAYVDAYFDGLVGLKPVAQVLGKPVNEVAMALDSTSESLDDEDWRAGN